MDVAKYCGFITKIKEKIGMNKAIQYSLTGECEIDVKQLTALHSLKTGRFTDTQHHLA